MEFLRALAVVIALVALASLPCLIAWMVVNADEAHDRAEQTVARLRPGTPAHRPIEQTAAALRRIADELVRTPPGAAERRGILIDEYDLALRRACATLGVEQYLTQLTGTDLDLERIRVEGELEAAGMILRGPNAGHDTWGRA
ncbi:hypothetical protein [Stackebrandtia soli]|uniref:hypothetical protein n=1 Tax=Stackebrandtia soli TaxID=1892856 RepID=UPI0039E73AE3